MRLYPAVALATLRRMTTYRGATVGGVVTNTVFGLVLASVLSAVFTARPEIGGFDRTDAVTFTFVTQGLLMVTGIFGNFEQASRITNGDVALELARPYDYQGWWMSVWYGRAAFYSVFRGIPPFLVGGLLFELRLPEEPLTWLWFLISVILGSGVAFAFGFIVSCSAFWLLDIRGPSQLAWFTAQFLAGVFLPLVLLPDGLVEIARSLPFAAMIQLPVEVFLGLPAGGTVLGLWGRQALWFAALVAIGRFVMTRAERRVVIQGG